ncbi:MAG: LamG domain-containing protein [Opitutaceae bacterium]|jgi:hypothetical protein|nr:LamG domain-containing protein [Opitutaceae bacterium]
MKTKIPFATRIHIIPTTVLVAILTLAGTSPGNAQTDAVVIPAPTLEWNFDNATITDGAGTAPDATGNDHAGAIKGNVTTTPAGISGGALTGFSSAASTVTYATGTKNLLNDGSLTTTFWFKNPGATTTSNRTLLAGIGSPDAGGDRTLEIWLGATDEETGQRTVNLSYGNWNGGNSITTSTTGMTFASDTWYQLAFVWQKTGSLSTTAFSYSVYLTSENAAELDAPLLSTTLNVGNGTGPADGDKNLTKGGTVFYVGGYSAGYYASFKPAGFLGENSSLDEVSLWIGSALTLEQLNANFALHAVAIPEPATLVLVCGFAGLFVAIVHRRRSP